MRTPLQFRQWLLHTIDRLDYRSKPLTRAEIPEGAEVFETDEEWPGPDDVVYESAADVVREAGEIALRFGLPDLYRECQVRSPMLRITLAKEMLGQCLEAVYKLPPDMTVDGLPDKEDETGEEPKGSLGLIYARAYSQYADAEKALGKGITDERAYRWLRGHKEEDNVEFPPSGTWCRYLRKARQHYGTPKHSPRAGRTGGSIGSVHDI